MFRKVLVANRGEIAVRVIRALRELGIPSVAVYSDADRASLHVRLADEAMRIGPAAASESYLNSDRILEAAAATGAEAIHPGYGFLSENFEFAAACEAGGVVFVGPPASAIRKMGLKTEARRMAKSAGTPVVPGSEDPVESVEEARRAAGMIGYPVMLKASAGGGGKGMRRVRTEAELEPAYRDASSEAERAFRNGAVYVEKLVENPRHIEIQVLGDRHGQMIHLGERECSIQRRHQKVIEESPSPFVAARSGLREEMGEAAIRAARAAGYYNAGTVEFLVDQDGAFYFLEMNTRLQVEHPVTELVTGVDLVSWQLRIAAGERLNLQQSDVGWRGSAIECRICAEDPDSGFLPCPGKIDFVEAPLGPGIRVDSGIYSGWTVPVEYDPLLAKLIAWAPERQHAVQRLLRALSEFAIDGIKTNLGFFRGVLEDGAFRAGELHTGFIEEFLDRRRVAEADAEALAAAAVAAMRHRESTRVRPDSGRGGPGRWRSEGRASEMR
jgi:acetyl-CoA carboxylase biotin carboxylase subunit